MFCSSVQFSSVAQPCLTLCDTMNRSTPGLPVHHQLPESTQTHVQWVHPNPCPSNHLIFCHHLLLLPQPFPASGSFQMSQLFTWGGQSIGVSASASVLPINTQDWSPLGWTDWTSLQSKGLSRVFSNTTGVVFCCGHYYFPTFLLLLKSRRWGWWWENCIMFYSPHVLFWTYTWDSISSCWLTSNSPICWGCSLLQGQL